jgi:hypothetical protein
MNWYVYANGNPVVFVDPNGLDVTIPGIGGHPWLVFDGGSVDQLGMSARATLSGLVTGGSFGLLHPDWSDPCDQYGDFSRTMGIGSGAALAAAGTVGAAEAATARVVAARRAIAARRWVTVSRWGRAGLQRGDWVMKGNPNWVNYILSGKWQPGFGNQFAPFSSGAAYRVPISSLRWPSGLNAVKGLLGQRLYVP